MPPDTSDRTSSPAKVVVWNEHIHERENPSVASLYPDGIHATLASAIETNANATCRTATLGDPEHGLTTTVLKESDTLVWWGHQAHDRVEDAVVERVYQEVLSGLGLVVLHSAHFSRIFRRLMGTNCSLKWREAGEKERLWNLQPSHPIMNGVGEYFELDREEMYGERFDIPDPEELLMVSWFQGGEVFRSLCTWQRGHGKVVYFRPGHETYPTFHDPHVQRIIANASTWARRRARQDTRDAPNTDALESLANG